MKRITQALAGLAAAALLGSTGAAQATLIDRGGGLIYDTTLNVTWLADIGVAQGSAFDLFGNGAVNWDGAVAWAGSLVYGGFSDWRLPTLNPADTSCAFAIDPGGGFPVQHAGFDCTGGELTHLFTVDLGVAGATSIAARFNPTAEQDANLALFSAGLPAAGYWSGTPYAPDTSMAWLYDASAGIQGNTFKSNAALVLAVRDGDVAAAVPEPSVPALLAVVLGASVVARRRRPR